MGVAVIVLTELGVARPMPLVLNRPALPHKTQQGLWADAQCGDEQVNMVNGLPSRPPLLTSSTIQLAPIHRFRMASTALRARRVQRTWRPRLASKSLIATGNCR